MAELKLKVSAEQVGNKIPDTKENEAELKPVKSKKSYYNVINVTNEVQAPGWTMNLTRGQIKVSEEGLATLAEVQNLSAYIRLVD
jgi:hypothetical protein